MLTGLLCCRVVVAEYPLERVLILLMQSERLGRLAS
jgi:hypothetical protein